MYCSHFLPSDYLIEQKRLSPIVAFCSLKFSLNIAINKKKIIVPKKGIKVKQLLRQMCRMLIYIYHENDQKNNKKRKIPEIKMNYN